MGIHASQTVQIPPEVEVKIKARQVVVKGPRGTLRRHFRHLAVDIRMNSKNTILVEKWFGIKKELAAVRTSAPILRTCSRESSRATSTRCVPYMLISPSTLPSLRETPLLRYVTSWE